MWSYNKEYQCQTPSPMQWKCEPFIVKEIMNDFLLLSCHACIFNYFQFEKLTKNVSM